MENTIHHIDELIGKYLAGEASASELAQVNTWANESEANRKHVEQFRTIFNRTAAIKDLQYFDEDAAWIKMKAKLQSPKAKVVALQPETSTYKFLYRIAASIIIVLGVGIFLYKAFNAQSLEPVEIVAETKTVDSTLPDGSVVVINKESKLAYSFDKKKNTHVVKLKGEAYFNIKHDNEKKFLIDIAGIYIRDIGTKFNVKAYPKSNTIEVVVEEGEIEFFTDTDSGVYLHASGKGVYDKLTKKFFIEQPEPNVLAYKTKLFAFSDSELSSVADDLNNVYNTKITVADNIKNCRLTVTFNNEDIDEIVSVIAETLNLTVTKSGQEIILEGSGCAN